MGSDEDNAFKLLRKNRDLQRPLIKKYRGEWLKEMGDGILASFHTASDAVRCAGEIQNEAKKAGIPLRIGIHEGEVVFEGSDVLGDGVNVASRLEEYAPEGYTYISGAVYKDIKNKAGIVAEFVEDKTFKNVDEPVKVYQVHYEKPETGQMGSAVPEPLKSPRLYYLFGGVIVVLIAVIFWLVLPTKDPAPVVTEIGTEMIDRSIAVLPFRNDSPDQENEYFCNGMMEEVLTNLQKIKELNVRSRTSVEQYRDSQKDIKQIADELNVKYVVEGNVQKIGDNIKIIAQLIEAKSDNHLWAETYSGKYTEKIFDFQSAVALKIASSLDAIITSDEKELIEEKPTSDITAYDYYLQGYHMISTFWNTMDTKYLTFAHDFYSKAIEIDPNFGQAIMLKMSIFFASREYDSTIVYANRLIELHPENSTGYLTLGECYSFFGMYDLAIGSLEKAVELNPDNAWANLSLGSVLIRQRKRDVNGFFYLQKSLELSDVKNRPALYLNIGTSFFTIGDYKRAKENVKKAIELKVGCVGIISFSWALLIQGKYDQAIHFLDSICTLNACEDVCNRLLYLNNLFSGRFYVAEKYYNDLIESGFKVDTRDSIFYSYLLTKTGREDRARDINDRIHDSLENQLAQHETSEKLWLISLNYLLAGEIEKSLDYLSKAEKRGFRLGWPDLMENNPMFESIRDNPKCRAIIKREQDKNAAVRKQLNEIIESGEIDL